MKKFLLVVLCTLLLSNQAAAEYTLTVTNKIELEDTELVPVIGRRISVDTVLKALDELEYCYAEDYRIFVTSLSANGGTILGRAYSSKDIYLFIPRGEVSNERYEATIIHEVGHLVFDAYTMEQRIEYFRIRGLGDEFGDARWFPYRNRPSEIFAEDFRILFGGDNARALRHINRYLTHPDEVVGLKEFIKSLE